jgi:hypothetical protein
LFSLVLGLGYLDKFIIPALPVSQQANGNYVLIVLQAMLAISGLGLLVDRFVHTPLQRLSKKFYEQRLIELGIPEGSDSGPDAT